MKWLLSLLVLLLVIGFVGCGEDDEITTPTLDSPSGLTAAALSHNEVQLTWTHGSGEVTFAVERSLD